MRFRIAGFLASFLLAGQAPSQVLPTHRDPSKVLQGCGACHAGGHGVKQTALLRAGSTEVCLRCHDLRSAERSLTITARSDLRRALEKPSRHPLQETADLHRRGEGLPEKSPGARRHVACVDCHDPHWSRPDDTLARVDGINTFRVRVRQAAAEAEICYKCHGDSANLPQTSRNKTTEFSRSNPSYHPLEAAGKSLRVPSLIRPLNEQSTLKCSDCHGADDQSGPRGPHASIYSPILVAHYETNDGLSEDSFQYALCYRCHDRSSILANQSFPLHNRHIIMGKSSCFACHTSHGSQVNTHLIFFNPAVAGFPQGLPSAPGTRPRARLAAPALPRPVRLAPPPLGGGMEFGRYVDFGNGHGQCYVSCHGVEHNPAEY